MLAWTVYIHAINTDNILCAVVAADDALAAEDAAAASWGLADASYRIVVTLPGIHRDRRNADRFKDARPATAHRAMADAAARTRAERATAAVRRLLARAGFAADLGPESLRPAVTPP